MVRDENQWVYLVFIAINLVYGVFIVLVHLAAERSLRLFTAALDRM